MHFAVVFVPEIKVFGTALAPFQLSFIPKLSVAIIPKSSAGIPTVLLLPCLGLAEGVFVLRTRAHKLSSG